MTKEERERVQDHREGVVAEIKACNRAGDGRGVISTFADWGHLSLGYVHDLLVANARVQGIVEDAYREGWEDAARRHESETFGIESDWHESEAAKEQADG